MRRPPAFKYELMPNGEQQRTMRRVAGSCRFVFNKALVLQQARYAEDKKKLSYTDLYKHLTEWRKSDETPWLVETHSQALQQTLKDLERACKNFFEKRPHFPRFKKKGQSDSFGYQKGGKLDQTNGRICPCGGHVAKENRLSQARFVCVGCGFEENADLVGAINVLRAGHARFACAETSPVVRGVGPRTHRSESGDGRLNAVGTLVL